MNLSSPLAVTDDPMPAHVQDLLNVRTRELRESEERLRTLFDHAPISMWEEDFSAVKARFDALRAQGVRDWRRYFDEHPDAVRECVTLAKVTDVNETSVAFFQAGSKENLSRTLVDYFTEESLMVFEEEVIALAEGRTSFESEIPIRNLQGETRILWLTLKVVPGQAETLGRVLVSFIDITAQKSQEEALRLQSLVLDQIQDHVTITDLDGVISYVNQAQVNQLGYPKEALLGQPTDVYGEDPEHGATQQEIVETTLRAGSWRGEVVNYAADGGEHVMDCRTQVVFDAHGVPTALCGIATDVTEYRRTEHALRENEARYRSLSEDMPVYICSFLPDGALTYVNAPLAALVGRQPDDLIGRCFFEMGEREAMQVVREQLQALTPDRAVATYVRPHQALDGSVRTQQWTNRAFFDAHGRHERFQAIGEDITERKRAEEEKSRLESQLQQAQRMESIGRLAGGVAHDFNNMLSVILGHTELALSQMDLAHPLYGDLEEIRHAATRSADLTRQLLAFARKQTIAPRVLDLNDTVEGMLKMLRRLIGEDVRLAWLPGKDVWPVNVDPSQIDQILANLCVNARDAIAGVGKMTIETANVTFDEAYCATHAGYVPGEYVRFTVSDDGCGMDKETLSHLFEPFFTTKDIGKGTGLGLATVYGIVKQNHGFINVYSEPGHGTTFTIALPRHVGKTAQAQTTGTAEPAGRGHETILLVEDEPAILNLTRTMLERQGYTVLAAHTPGAAIRIAREYAGEIHLLMTDVVMPEMNGRDLARNLLSLYPHLARLFMSGYTSDVIAHHGVLDAGVQFIQKPFSMQDLTARVRDALGHAGE